MMFNFLRDVPARVYLVWAGLLWLSGPTSGYRENVLLILTDDMRADIQGAYYDPTNVNDVIHKQPVHTPNLDRLAADSAIFTHAYTQYPVCGPSRASMLTGRRPENLGTFDNHHKIRPECAQITSLIRYLRANKYKTATIGKSFHHYGPHEMPFDSPSWSVIHPSTPDDILEEISSAHYVSANKSARPKLVDEITVDHVKEFFLDHTLQRFNKKPFFVTVGFRRPHLPNIVPENFRDLYPLEDIIEPDDITSRPTSPCVAGMVGGKFGVGELSTYADVQPFTREFISRLREKQASGNLTVEDRCFNGNFMDKNTSSQIRQGYYAAVSYIDSLVGDILGELKKQDLEKNTIVVFASDHGYHLGENAIWGKFTLYETNLRVPLLMRIPEVTDGGVTLSEPVELLDVLPTLYSRVGLRSPDRCQSRCVPSRYPCTDGKSLLRLIYSKFPKFSYLFPNPRPLRFMEEEFQYVAYSQVFRRPVNMPDGSSKGMGYSVRSRNFRYNEWLVCPRNQQDYIRVVAREFYDHRADPYEMENVVDTYSEQIYVRIMADYLDRFRANVTMAGDRLMYICEQVGRMESFKTRDLPTPRRRRITTVAPPEEDRDDGRINLYMIPEHLREAYLEFRKNQGDDDLK